MKKIIILFMVIFVGCGIHRHVVSRHRVMPAAEYEAAWSRAHAYCTRYGIDFADINPYTMFIDKRITLTRELHGSNAVLRYTTLFEYNTEYPITIRQEKYKLKSIDTMVNYIVGLDSPHKLDRELPKELK